MDAPEWFNQKLKAKDQPKLTKPVGTFRLGAHHRVVLKPLIEIDPYNTNLPSAVEPIKCRPGYIPTEEDKQQHSLPPSGTLPARLGSTTSADIGAGDVEYELKVQKSAPRDRLGKTSSAYIGSGTEVASFASDKISDTRRALEKSTYSERTKSLLLQETINQSNTVDLNNSNNPHIKRYYTTAKYTDEPPFRNYYTKANEGNPNGSVTVRPLRTGRAGHLLWQSEVNTYGTQPAQHLGNTLNTLYEQGIGNVTARLVSPNNNQSSSSSSPIRPSSPQRRRSSLQISSHDNTFSTTSNTIISQRPSTTGGTGRSIPTNLRQVPLNWYNASR